MMGSRGGSREGAAGSKKMAKELELKGIDPLTSAISAQHLLRGCVDAKTALYH